MTFYLENIPRNVTKKAPNLKKIRKYQQGLNTTNLNDQTRNKHNAPKINTTATEKFKNS